MRADEILSWRMHTYRKLEANEFITGMGSQHDFKLIIAFFEMQIK